MYLLLTVAVLVFVAQGALAISDDELAQFTSERYRVDGFQGWVSVKETTRRGVTTVTITSNGIPDHEVGDFPSDDNPNEIEEQSVSMYIPKDPTPVSGNPGCMSMGIIAVALNGVPMFNLYNHLYGDAMETEVFDDCNGHPDVSGTYHYHHDPWCVTDRSSDKFLGVALDGYPIYGNIDENGNTLTSSDLDICHGRTDKDGNYKYHATEDYPYIIGCFMGETLSESDDTCVYSCNEDGDTSNYSDTSFCTDWLDSV